VAKDALGALSDVVPASIASSGVRGGRRVTGPRSDHPVGREGVDLLAAVPLFAGLSRRHLRKIAEHADIARFREREPIVEAGQPGGTFFVILEGAARVNRNGKTIDKMAPGDFFGEISLLDGGVRTATVIAETPVTTIRIFKRSFDRVVASEPGVASKILAVVARRLREAERSIND
jgi:CRP-like cAMP-binding protein